MPRIVAFSLPDDLYEELKRRAGRRGYSLVSDYVRALVLRELGYGDEAERIRELIREELRKLVAEGSEVKVEPVDVDKLLEKLQARLERRLQDMINPWTAKIDQIQARLAELQEKIEGIEERLKGAEPREEKATRERSGGAFQQSAAFQGERGERREYRPHGKRKTAIDRLREQGVVYEHDVQWLRDRDAFFEKLRREGAVIFDLGGERVAVDPTFWENFKEKLEMLPTANEEEIKLLLTSQQYELFKRLKEAGLVYFDATKRAWRLTEEEPKES